MNYKVWNDETLEFEDHTEEELAQELSVFDGGELKVDSEGRIWSPDEEYKQFPDGIVFRSSVFPEELD